MKFLLGFSDLGYKTYNHLCINLKNKINNTKFIAVDPSPYVKKYLSNQKEVDYIFTEIEPQFDSDKFEIDYEYLKFFENKILKCSVWKVIASDRSYGKAYESGVKHNDFKLNFKSDRNYLLKYFAFRVQCIKKKLELHKPDYFIPAVAMGSVDTIIYSQLAKYLGIKYAVLNWLRVDNYCSFAHDYELNVKFFEKELIDSVKNDLNKEMSSEVEKLYENTVTKTKNRNLGKNENSKFGISLNYFEKYNLFFKVFGWPILISKAIYLSFRNNFYYLIKKNFYTLNKKINIFNFCYWFYKEFISKIIFYNQVFISKKVGLNNLPVNENYIYFPLQVQPEYSTNIQATMWMNNINFIENLSKSIPHDWYIYVKDHPAMVSDRVRPKNFYSKITKYPNVRLINVKTESNKIILNSKAIVCTSGTTAFDAILLGKPVIETRSNIWSNIKLSKICTDSEKFYEAICEETERVSKISQKERDQLIKHYFDVVLNFGFKQENIKEAFYNKIANEEDSKKCGYSMAEGFLKYLDCIQKNQ
ncbi:hypothetical protein OAP67_00710 [Candidatus Pelagibacter sp.]|nr:hypothetical protein [Candidatus Pelagibacter sp.]